ncbi:ATP-binding protein [Bacteroides caccae]|uniref:sensor histidine kinase n=1 Tax=Bacteroides caccae TaxID=47678 RepID=UPI0021091264|nr:PAS domain-containing sensor histidine kinase [Bacteroides caccae]MCQ5101696.1 ATP-binding protein [Bacteroides caccae]
MQNNENKTKEELIKIIEQLEKKVEDLSSMQSYPVQERFREKYSTRILDALPDMLTVFDHDANIIELASSPSTNHVEGINADNITHSNVKDILPPEAYESVRQNMDRVILTGESSTSRHDLMLDGILHHYENRIFPLDKEYLLCMCRDISEQWNAEQTNKKQQKELEAARIKAEESDRLKSAFLANMSHEIRTPLNAIVGFSKLVIDAECTNEKEQYAEIIERNSEILLNLFNDILDLSSLEADSLSFNIRPIKLIDICLQLEQQFCYKVKNGTKLILDDVDTELYVSGDWNRIIQIISNLLSNAAKFTPKGEIHFGYREKEDFVEFYVKDSGIGIPAERVATIFQRFGKINDFVQGIGLGLTLYRMLVEKMGGRIWLRSQEGKGSRFYFTLPLIRQ